MQVLVNGEDSLGDQDVDQKIILKRTLNRQYMWEWTESSGLKQGQVASDSELFDESGGFLDEQLITS